MLGSARIRSGVAALCVVGVLVCVPAAAELYPADEDLVSNVVEACPLGPGKNAELVTLTGQWSCGNESCSGETTSRVRLEDRTLLTIDEVTGESDGRIVASCTGKVVRLVVDGDADNPVLELQYDPASEELEPVPGAAAYVERLWRLPPTKDIEEAQRRGSLARVLAQVEGEYTDRRALAYALEAVLARDQLALGAWRSAESLLDQSRGVGMPARLVRRKALVRAKLEAERRARLSLRLVDQRKLGTTLAVQQGPLAVGEAATMFWRGDDLCVLAEDPPPVRAMRCYSTKLGRWGGSVPVALPASDAHGLKGLGFPHVQRCTGGYVVQPGVPDGDTPCNGGPGEPLEELVAMAPGNAMLLAREHGSELNRAPGQNVAFSRREVNALVRSSAGSLVFGDGCCRFFDDWSVGRVGDGEEQRLDVFTRPANDESWLGLPLVSPDQHWVAAQTGYGPGKRSITLWLFRVALVHP